MSLEIQRAFNTLANMAGGVIEDGRFVEKSTSVVNKTELSHEPADFYCLSVPGKAFFIRSQGKISVTGNSLHCDSMIKLFREYIKENKELWNDDLKSKIYVVAEKMVDLEDAFVDLAFGVNEMENLTKQEVKEYIRYIADRRLIALGLKVIFKRKKNPLPWVDGMLGVSHTNFFENRSTDYAKGALTGDWGDVWAR